MSNLANTACSWILVGWFRLGEISLNNFFYIMLSGFLILDSLIIESKTFFYETNIYEKLAMAYELYDFRAIAFVL